VAAIVVVVAALVDVVEVTIAVVFLARGGLRGTID
jgi:hypothetical protein